MSFTLDDGTVLPRRLIDRFAMHAHWLHLLHASPISGARLVDEHGNTVAELDLGRTSRYANRAQRRALAARDGGCAFPGCDRPPGWTDAHHITWWEHGGTTDLDNLTSLCRFHHLLIHAGLYQVVMGKEHQPCFTTPDGQPLPQRRRRRPRHTGPAH